jgi:hypothetical protein
VLPSVATDSIASASLSLALSISAYFHRSWVNLPWGASERELRHRLAASYKLVRASLPKKVQAQLLKRGRDAL